MTQVNGDLYRNNVNYLAAPRLAKLLDTRVTLG